MIRTLKLQLIHVFFLALAMGSNNQAYLFETIDITDGLTQNSVVAIAKDRYGFMWFGTEDGLNRYDGISFKVFRHDPLNASSLNSSTILSTLIDHNGDLWVGTFASGLNKYIYKTESFDHYPHDLLDSLSIGEGSIQALHEDHFGHIWVGTAGGGLFRLNPKTGKSTPLRTLVDDGVALSDSSVLSLFEDHQHQLWISTMDGLNVLDLQTYELRSYHYNPDEPGSLFDDYINTVYETYDGTSHQLWVGTNWGGFDLYDPEQNKFTHYGFKSSINPNFPETGIMWMLQENSERLWLGTDSDGILIVDKSGKLIDRIERRVYDQTTLQDDIINTLYDDGDIIWVGTSSGGVCKYARHRKQFFSLTYDPLDPNGLHDDRILRTVIDRDGNLWIATWTEGLTLYNSVTHSFTVYKHDPADPGSLSDNGIQDILVDRNNNLWVISASSTLDVLRANTTAFEHIAADFDDSTALRSDYLTISYEDPHGYLWFGSWDQGLTKLNPETGVFQTFYDPAVNDISLGDISFYALFMDSQGILWIGAENEGLIAFDEKQMTLKQYRAIPSDPYALPHNDVMCFLEDDDGNIWLGTYGGGLTRFDPRSGTFESFGSEQGLLSQTIYKIFMDKQGDLWVSTNDGLARFNIESKTFKNYGIPDGVLSKEFNPAGCVDEQGWFYFGGVKGVTYFDPSQIKDNTHIPPLHFTGLSIMNKPIQVNEVYHNRVVLDQTIIDEPQLQLFPEDLFFSVQFASLDYYYSRSNQYAYQLEGFDTGWRFIGQKQEVTFTNLPAGSYLLKVKGTNNDGVWNETGASLKIVVQPEIYETWWFTATIALLLILTIFLIYRLRTAFLVRRGRELELHNLELNAQIESRRKAHLRAHERADYFRAVISQSPLPMAIHNTLGNITHMNQGWVSLWCAESAEDIIRDYQIDSDALAKQLQLGTSFKRALQGDIVEHPEVTFTSPDGQTKVVHLLLYPLKAKTGSTNQVMISLEDITEIVHHRTLLEKSLKEKELLLKEVHHRVKNNLQIVVSLLGLQKASIGDAESIRILDEFRNRVNSMALVHDALYRSPEFDNIDIASYIEELSSGLQTALSHHLEPVQIITDIPQINLSVDIAVPSGLLINELVTNALKYAFPEPDRTDKKIIIRFTHLDNDTMRIEVIDNGVGIQVPIVWDSVDSLGLYLVKILGEEQLMGQVSINCDSGTHVTIEFPLNPDFDN